MVAWACYSSFRLEKAKSNLSNKFDKRLKEGNLTEKDQRNMVSVMYVTAYIFGCILIAIPGIVTDILGILLVIPPINRFFTASLFAKSIENYFVRKRISSSK